MVLVEPSNFDCDSLVHEKIRSDIAIGLELHKFVPDVLQVFFGYALCCVHEV
jgi:hypothetical protein